MDIFNFATFSMIFVSFLSTSLFIIAWIENNFIFNSSCQSENFYLMHHFHSKFLYKEHRHFLIWYEAKFANFRNIWRIKSIVLQPLLLSRLVWFVSTNGDARRFFDLLLWKYCFYVAFLCLQPVTLAVPISISSMLNDCSSAELR